MSKNTQKKKRQAVPANQKISAFFKLKSTSKNSESPTKTISQNKVLCTKTIVISLSSDDDDDFISQTPEEKPVKAKRSKNKSRVATNKVLEPITNLPSSSASESLELSTNTKKRKTSSSIIEEDNVDGKENEDTCIIEEIKSKKICLGSDLTDFKDNYNCDKNDTIDIVENTEDFANHLTTPSKIKVVSPSRLLKHFSPTKISKVSPDKQGSTSPLKVSKSPKRLLNFKGQEEKSTIENERLDLINLQKTPIKNICQNEPCSPNFSLSPSLLKSSEKWKKITPNKKKRTPSKLFCKSPKIEEFNVQILKDFVTVTPSKSCDAKVAKEKVTPSKSGDKKQKSILDYASNSKQGFEAQSRNEFTPVKPKSPKSESPTALKAKTKLEFNTDTGKTKTEDTMPQETTTIKSSPIKKITPKKLNGNSSFDNSELDDMFDESWAVEMVSHEFSLDLSETKHCKVLQIDRYLSKVSVIVECTKTKEKALCHLEGFWMNMKLEINSTIHLSAKQLTKEEWVVNNDSGLVIYEPDLLISSTSVVGSIFCKRRTALSERFQGFEPGNKQMTVGVLVHELLQKALKDKVRSEKEVQDILNTILKSRDTIYMLYSNSLMLEEIEKELSQFIPRIHNFIETYVKNNSKEMRVQSKKAINKADWKGQIDTIQDIEENIWCPQLGVKGKVDVSVKAGIKTIPLELKTGRATMSLEHRGQVILYIMMMKRFGYPVDSGLLLYLREGVLREITVTHKEQRDMMILRNELTYYLTQQPSIQNSDSNKESSITLAELPEPINHHSACGNCAYNNICSVYLENENADLSNNKKLDEIRANVMSYLEASHVEYFIHWTTLLQLENSRQDGKNLREIYTIPPLEREKQGKCIVNLSLISCESEGGEIWLHSFKKTENQAKGLNFFTSGISEGNYVVISTNTRPAVATGFVQTIHADTISVSIDRDLNIRYKNNKFHIDTYDSSSTQSFNLTNLALLLEDSDRCNQLRRLIINKEPPIYQAKLSKSIVTQCAPVLKKMNKSQQRAIIKALTANDYLLVKGMPGTGKTATIVALIQLLVSLNKTVLITSHTHSAVDNVCLRLNKLGIDILRLGSLGRIHPELKSRSESTLTKECKTIEEISKIYNSARVLAVTCLGSGHPVLSKRIFDYCIVDESTQVLQTSVIRVLSASKRLILVGDPDQLPPVVRNHDALSRGLGVSLFERLCNAENTIKLTYNYRMNKVITELANGLTYKGDLLIGNETIANATLNLSKNKDLLKELQHKTWLMKILDTSIESSVQIIDTGSTHDLVHDISWLSKAKMLDTNHKSYTNAHESSLTYNIVQALLKGGISSENIGVMAPYRDQVAQLTILLHSLKIEVNTVDQFQGRDKEVIIYSCTKSKAKSSNTQISEYNILEDKRRLTVAITRAKHKLIMIADVDTIKCHTPFAQVFELVNEKNFVNLKKEELEFSWEDVINIDDTKV